MLSSLLVVPLALAAQDAAAPEAIDTPEVTETAEAAEAAEGTFSYDYFEFGIGVVDYDFLSDNGTAIDLGVSVGINETFNIVGNYRYETVDVGGLDVDGYFLFVGGGAHTPVHEKVDLYGELGLVFGRAEAAGFASTDTGIGLEGGVRTKPLERIELDAYLNYYAVNSSNFRLGLEGRGYVSEALSLGLKGLFDEDANSFALTLRYDF